MSTALESEAWSALERGDLNRVQVIRRKLSRWDANNSGARLLGAYLSLREGDFLAAVDGATALREHNAGGLDHKALGKLVELCFRCELYDQCLGWVEALLAANAAMLVDRYRAGISAWKTGKPALAESHFLFCIEQQPDVAASYLQLGHVYKSLSRPDDAEASYRDYIARTRADRAHGYWSLADLKNTVFTAADVKVIEEALVDPSLSVGERSIYLFTLGKVAEDAGDYSEALKHYREANSLQIRLRPFNVQQFEELSGVLLQVSPPAAENTAVAGETDPTPVFIVGLPRSGTTLLEQILCAHSRVQATDELPFLERIGLRLEMEGGYARMLETMSSERALELRQVYLEDVKPWLDDSCDYFVDKNPSNFVHIGLIQRLFPEAIIINSRRDIRDIAISAYRQLFNVGNEFSWSFDSIATYYSHYRQLMDHWMRSGSSAIYGIQYEELVTDTDHHIEALLEFCGLAPEPACHDFYNSTRVVMTPSVSDVKQPAHTRSIGQWRHYAELLPAELQMLGELEKRV